MAEAEAEAGAGRGRARRLGSLVNPVRAVAVEGVVGGKRKSGPCGCGEALKYTRACSASTNRREPFGLSRT